MFEDGPWMMEKSHPEWGWVTVISYLQRRWDPHVHTIKWVSMSPPSSTGDATYIGGWGSETGLSVPPNREIVFRVRDVIATRSCVSARRDAGAAGAGGTQISSCSCCLPLACPVASQRVMARPGEGVSSYFWYFQWYYPVARIIHCRHELKPLSISIDR